MSVNGDGAEVFVGGTIYKTGLQIPENLHVGEYILWHAGFAIQNRYKEGAEYALLLLRNSVF